MSTEGAVAQAEASINALTERRAQEAKGRDLWASSARLYAAKLRGEAKLQWASHFEHMARLHRQLAAEHEARARALLGKGGDEADQAAQAG